MDTQTSQATQAASESSEKRVQTRSRFKLRAEAYIEELGILNGFAKDISLQGLTFYLDRNLEKNKAINLRIHVPPITRSDKPHLVVAAGMTVYTIYDSRESNFRMGIKLNTFESEGDKKILQTYLNQR